MFNFTNLVSKKQTVQPVMTQPENNSSIPGEDLFIDPKAPAEEQKTVKKESMIRKFLNGNHYLAGLSAGYELHTHDGLPMHLKELRAKFREAVDSVLAELQQELNTKQILM